MAVITEVDNTGPGFIIGNLTTGYPSDLVTKQLLMLHCPAGCIIHTWNGVPLLNKSFEQTKSILNEQVLNNELSLLVCSRSVDIGIESLTNHTLHTYVE